MTFESLGLSPKMLEALAKKGFEEPTPVQQIAIPRLMTEGNALAARARTGTGKTAAFGIPLVEKLGDAPPPEGRGRVSAIVLVPTRELALQVTQEISSLKSGARPRMACVYGGASIGEQIRKLASGVDIVVGTPGRVLDHIGRGTLDISLVRYFILDEADEMLDMGFIEDIGSIMDTMNPQARILLFSATLAPEVLDVVKRRAGEIDIVEDASETLPTELAEQVWIELNEGDRLEVLSRIVDSEEEFYGIVFVSTKVEADSLAKSLGGRGYDVEALHGDLSQEARERVLGKFRDRRLSILVATDVAARGIDIEKLTHVINWSLPHDPESYLHRIGRTGRAGNEGTAITFVTPDEYRRLFLLKKISGKKLKKGSVPEVADLLQAKADRIFSRVVARAERDRPEAGTEGGTGCPTDSGRAIGDEGASAASVGCDTWKEMARDLLEKLGPEEALAAALAEGFPRELDPSRYGEISEVPSDHSAPGRLFIAAGKRDSLTPRSLATMIKRLSKLPDSLIGSIEVHDTFSFVSVPGGYAGMIMDEARRTGGFPDMRMAAPRKQGGEDEFRQAPAGSAARVSRLGRHSADTRRKKWGGPGEWRKGHVARNKKAMHNGR